MTQQLFNERLRQVILLGLIGVLIIILLKQISAFLPGILGAITFYILARKQYFRWVFKHKWKPGWSALLWVIIFFFVVAIPIYLSINILSPKIAAIVENPDKIVNSVKDVAEKLKDATGISLIKQNSLDKLTEKITTALPQLLNSTAAILTNLVMMFFLLYYLLVHGREIEKMLNRVIPLSNESINSLASETRMMVRANALGIPIISIIQGLVATIGYWIFGVPDWGMWGFVTAVFAFFPFVGIMIIWVPLLIALYSSGASTVTCVLFALYHILVSGNVDYVARMTLMRKIGDVHPVITVFGVIIGLKLFGFVGLVFGPVLISYFIVFVKIYIKEFGDPHALPKEFETAEAAVAKEVSDAKGNVAELEKNIGNIEDKAQKLKDSKSSS